MKKAVPSRKAKSKVGISNLQKKDAKKPSKRAKDDAAHGSLKIPLTIGVAAVVAGSYLLLRKK